MEAWEYRVCFSRGGRGALPGVLLTSLLLPPICLLYLAAVTCTSLGAAFALPGFVLESLAVPDELFISLLLAEQGESGFEG